MLVFLTLKLTVAIDLYYMNHQWFTLHFYWKKKGW